MSKALRERSPLPPLKIILRQRIITEPGRERLVLIVPIAGLAAALNGFSGDRMTLEHIFDY